MPASRPKLLAYSHDGYGLGHLRRNLRIASGLLSRRPDVEVVLATGARSAEDLAAGHGVACVQLPSVTKSAAGGYEPVEAGASLAAVVARRSAVLAGLVTDFAPDLLLVDRHPRGLRHELDAALRIHRRRPGALTVLGLRDILDEPAAVAREWAEHELAPVVENDYDAVFCYGDRAVYDLAAEYRFPQELTARLRYTGYLTDGLTRSAAPEVRPRPDGARLAVCTLGGGQDAAGIAEVFLAAMTRLRRSGWRGILITGPYMAQDDVDALRADDVAIIRMAPDVPRYLVQADAVLCMGGYNTTCEVLGLNVPAVIVPRTSPRLEQVMRAQRLAERGLVHWLHPEGLTPQVVAGALAYAADTPREELRSRMAALAHDGVHKTAELLSDMLPPDGALLPGTGRKEHALD